MPEENRLLHNRDEGRALTHLRRVGAKQVLWHHRFPTSTSNVHNACHPFSTKDYFEHNYVGVHNGVLWNEKELKSEHELRGIKYVSQQKSGDFNDSEALIYDIARYIEGEVKEITAEGTIAFIVVQMDKEGKQKAVYFGRNSGNPLVMKKTKKSITLSSEGEGEPIEPNVLYRMDNSGAIVGSPCRFPSYRTYGNYQGYNGGYDWENGASNSGFSGQARALLTPSQTEAFFSDEEDRERSFVKYERDKLEYESNYDLSAAIEIGEFQVERIEARKEKLKELVEHTFEATDAEEDEYYSLDNEQYYLKQAIDQLRLEVSGQSQIGFRYTTSAENYVDWHNKRVRESSVYPNY